MIVRLNLFDLNVIIAQAEHIATGNLTPVEAAQMAKKIADNVRDIRTEMVVQWLQQDVAESEDVA